MEENKKKAFDFAADLTKQLITLSTAVLAFTITFAKNNSGTMYTWQKAILILSWIMLILCIGFGIMTLMALTGNLDPIAGKSKFDKPVLTINSSNVRGTAILQVFCFLLGIVFTVWNGSKMIFADHAKGKPEKILLIHMSKSKIEPSVTDTLVVPATDKQN